VAVAALLFAVSLPTAAQLPSASSSTLPSPSPIGDTTAIAKEAQGWLADLIHINTTNPPGNEHATAKYIADLLQKEGVPSETLEAVPGRSALVARLRGSAIANPSRALLLVAHMDVVGVDKSKWTVDPFGAVIKDGYLYGRGAIDFLITHLNGETNTLFRSNGDGTFTDVTAAAGMGFVDRPFTGWGTGFLDCDNDGEMDVAVVNGRVSKRRGHGPAELGPFWSHYAETNLLFLADGKGGFVHACDKAGDFCAKSEVHRGLAFADLRNRGAIDLVTSNVDNTVRVFRNDAAGKGGHWLQVMPMIGKREALGAKVIVSAEGRMRMGLCLRAYSYISSSNPRVHFGLGKAQKVDSLEVQWPSGMPRNEKFDVAGVDRVLVVEQGKGAAVK